MYICLGESACSAKGGFEVGRICPDSLIGVHHVSAVKITVLTILYYLD